MTVDAAAFRLLELPTAEDPIAMLAAPMSEVVGEWDVVEGGSTTGVVEDSEIVELSASMLKLVLNNIVVDPAAFGLVELLRAWDCVVVLAAPIFELVTD